MRKRRKKRRRAVITTILLILLFILLFTTALMMLGPAKRVSQLSAYDDSWNDISRFRDSIKEMNVRTSNIVSSPTLLKTLSDEEINNTIFISIGVEKRYTSAEAWAIYEFYHRGGKLIIADDFGYGNSISNKQFSEDWKGFGVQFSKARLWDEKYIKNPLFVVVPISSMSYEGTELFTLPADLYAYVTPGLIREELIDVFVDNGIEISPNAEIRDTGSSNRWALKDGPMEYRLHLTPEGVKVFSLTVVLNDPSALSPGKYNENLVKLRSSPGDGSWIDINDNGMRDIAESDLTNRYPKGFPIMYELSVNTESGAVGRALFISDPSLFLNDMWKYNSGFCAHLVRHLLGDETLSSGEGMVIFDESRHVADGVISPLRKETYTSQVLLLTDTNLRILMPVVVVMFLLILIVAVDDPRILRHKFDIDRVSLYNLRNSNIRDRDADRIRALLLEKVRLATGMSWDDFKELDSDELEEMVGNRSLTAFLMNLEGSYSISEIEDLLVVIRDWQLDDLTGGVNHLD